MSRLQRSLAVSDLVIPTRPANLPIRLMCSKRSCLDPLTTQLPDTNPRHTCTSGAVASMVIRDLRQHTVYIFDVGVCETSTLPPTPT